MTRKTENKYSVILADPPWAYKNKKTGGSLRSGALAHYDCLTQEDLKNLSVPDVAAEDSVLFLWATNPMLPEAFEVMAAWEYQYKTMLTWHKLTKRGKSLYGLGHYFRGTTEFLLVGIRGKVKAFKSKSRNLFSAVSKGHSIKPDEAFELIESATSHLPRTRLELFARRTRPGWDAWGNEIESDIGLYFNGKGVE